MGAFSKLNEVISLESELALHDGQVGGKGVVLMMV